MMRIWTIGHSTRSVDEFISLLNENGIELLADVRSFPGSRRYPHFGKAALARSLNGHAIRYEHFPELGGRRKPKPDSHNTAWRNASFRGYADYMETKEFQKGIERFLACARNDGLGSRRDERDGFEAVTPWPVAIMCAEAVWWRCHRALISDFLKARGVEVLHVLGANKIEPHPYTSAAHIINGALSYGSETDRLI
ncbi:MAG TPA: DUF488 domain-containing protein [Candidatus Udaeobacter sp.]|jgi:uncharacterized protein (DUF488 family)|nr:DUF488 domain-containing protein [Candidatus Udaeobacter sp.]